MSNPISILPLLPGTPELIQDFQAHLTKRQPLSSRQLINAAAKHLGLPIGHGLYDFRYIYDALEVALHQLIETLIPRLIQLTPSDAITELEALVGCLPTPRIRTEEQDLFQQFSTPSTVAFLAASIAFPNPSQSLVTLEPSAGTGALACIARALGGNVTTNDLSTKRQAFLQFLGFDVHGFDAETIDDLLPTEIAPSVILMNPPFSSTAGRLSRNDNIHGARHIESCLRRLESGGRLVSVTGRGMALDRDRMTDYWQRIASRYTILLNATLPPASFTKSGTTWETQLITIDKTGPTPGSSWTEQVSNIRYGSLGNVSELLTLYRNGELFHSAATPSEKHSGPTTTTIHIQDSNNAVTVEALESLPTPEELNEDEDHNDSDNGFVAYTSPRLVGGQPHPAPLVETASMAAVIPPPITYRPWLDPQLIIDGAISNVQLERICYAGQRHSQRLSNNARAAYLLGDGTGFGKGRCLAGIIVDNHNQGRTKTLWLSISNQLLESTRRDLNDLNAPQLPLHQLNDWDVNEPINFKEGVIFCSYSTLIAKSKISNKTRLEQLIEWLGEDGLIILDECQRAQHALATAQGDSTQTGKAVLELQDPELRPNLRFVYSSATSVVEVSHICYMARLGLWGPGTSFPEGFTQFMSEIEAGGLGALEMVTRSMKAFGMSHASTLSYGKDPVSGLAVEYTEVFHELTSQQREIYNNAAAAWQVVLQNIETALEITDAGTRKRAFALSHFWAQHQAFFRQVITAFKVPECIRQIEASLKRKESIVVSVIGTAEAKSKVLVARAAAQGERLEDLDFSPRATLCALVERAFPVDLYQKVEDSTSGNIVTVRVTDAAGNPVQSKEALRMRAELLEKLSDLVLPENPLDQIINYFGPDQVAEISGRRKRLIRDPLTGHVQYVSRAPKGVPMNKVNTHENEQFQNGIKRISIITAAGSTGISLHASLNAINQQRRCHIVLELAWSAVLQMQSFGRTHRSFQACPPKYILLSTNLGGERRFSATIARRLASLGALCKGDRKAADGGTQLSRYTFESALGRGTLNLLYRRIFESAEIPNLDQPRQTLEDMGLLNEDGELNDRDRYHIPRFLNRLLSLDCDRQNALFAYYSDLFDECVAHAKASGTFDEGVQDIEALSIKLVGQPETVYVDETTRAETLHYTLAVEIRSSRVSPEKALSLLTESSVGGFYRQTKGNIVLLTQSGNHTDHESGNTYQTYAVTKPEEARSYYITDTELAKYKKVQKQSALAWWDFAYKSLPETSTSEVHLIAGAVLPLWDKLKTTQDAQLRVVRVVTEENERIVGVRIPANRVRQILRALGIGQTIADPEQIISAVLSDDDHITLTENFSLARARVYSDQYVELRGASHHKFSSLRELGLLNMRIDYRERFFLPTDPQQAIEILKRLLAQYPVETKVEEETEPVHESLLTENLQAFVRTETVNIFDLLETPIHLQPIPLPSLPTNPEMPIPLDEFLHPTPISTFTQQLSLWA